MSAKLSSPSTMHLQHCLETTVSDKWVGWGGVGCERTQRAPRRAVGVCAKATPPAPINNPCIPFVIPPIYTHALAAPRKRRRVQQRVATVPQRFTLALLLLLLATAAAAAAVIAFPDRLPVPEEQQHQPGLQNQKGGDDGRRAGSSSGWKWGSVHHSKDSVAERACGKQVP